MVFEISVLLLSSFQKLDLYVAFDIKNYQDKKIRRHSTIGEARGKGIIIVDTSPLNFLFALREFARRADR